MTTKTLTNKNDTYSVTYSEADPTLGPYTLYGLKGNDTINAYVGVGTFFIFGDEGDDLINTGGTSVPAIYNVNGGAGRDTIIGHGGTNHFIGGAGNDTLSGSWGIYTFEGGAGNDTIALDNWSSGTLDGGSGNDILTATAQRAQFVMHGGSGDDQLRAIPGNQGMYALDEQFFGDAGNDVIYSINGNDTLDGGTGNDRLHGGDGNDTLSGGAGKDVFVFANRWEGAKNVVFADIITDFSANDKIEFLGTDLSFEDLTITQGIKGTGIHYTDNKGFVDYILLTGVHSTTIGIEDFVFG